MTYDPEKAHAYYEQTKKLKGRGGANTSTDASKPPPTPSKGHSSAKAPTISNETKVAQDRVIRLKAAVSKLESALTEARSLLSKKRQEATATEKKNSDGKSTIAEKQASQKYRDTHKAETAAKSSSSTSGGSSTSSTSLSDMSVSELETRIINIQRTLSDAKAQLSNATQQLGQLAHSDLTSEPTFNEHFARFQ